MGFVVIVVFLPQNPAKAKKMRKFIVAEGLYLNYGDLAPLPKMVCCNTCFLVYSQCYQYTDCVFQYTLSVISILTVCFSIFTVYSMPMLIVLRSNSETSIALR